MLKKLNTKSEKTVYVRNFIFGVEDSLVSTVGLLSGVAVANVPSSTIILSGLVLIFVEALSMGAGSLLSEKTANEYEGGSTKDYKKPATGAAIMFLSYFVAGFIPLAPYIILDVQTAFVVAILLSLLSLFVLGIVSGKLFKIHTVGHGLEMLVIGGLAVAAGIVVGKLVKV